MEQEYTCEWNGGCAYKVAKTTPSIAKQTSNTNIRNIHARCTKSEYKQFMADIKALGFPSLQSFIKTVILEVRKLADKKEIKNEF